MNRLIPYPEFDAELALVRHLLKELPWQRGGNEERGLRSEFRHWTVADHEPSPIMLASLWMRVPGDGWNGLSDTGLDRAVHHAALLLHLLAVGVQPPHEKPPEINLGTAAKLAGVKEGRFTRLVSTPGPARLAAVSRLFRQLRQKNIFYKLTWPAPGDGERDRRSTRRTLRDGRVDDLAAILVFLFSDDPKPAISRWAAGYYRTEDIVPVPSSLN